MTDRLANPKSYGQKIYEADVMKRPTYHDGTPRRSWDQLSAVAQESWERGPCTCVDYDGFADCPVHL